MRVLVLGLLLSLQLCIIHSAGAGHLSPYERRELLSAYAENLLINEALHQKSMSRDQIENARELFLSYRVSKKPILHPIAEGPYPGYLITSPIKKLIRHIQAFYPAAGLSESQGRYYSTEVDLEALMDLLMFAVINNAFPEDLSPEIKKMANNSDLKKLAPQVLKAKTTFPDCNVHVGMGLPGWWHLRVLVGAGDDCYIRRAVYNSVRDELLDQVDKLYEEWPKMAARKLGAPYSEAMFERAEVFQRLDRDSSGRSQFENDLKIKVPDQPEPQPYIRMTLKDIAAGHQADLDMLRLLLRDDQPENRSIVAALAYNVAGSYIAFQGGNRAYGKSDGFKIDQWKLWSRPFGGMSLKPDQKEGLRFGFWDLEEYDLLSTDQSGRPLHSINLFPSEFYLGPNFHVTHHPMLRNRGMLRHYYVESMDELLDILYAFAESMDSLRRGALSLYWQEREGPEMDAALMDPHDPALFPFEGRKLVIGTVAAALQNLVAPQIGHMEAQDLAKDPSAFLRFFEKVRLDGRLTSVTPTRSVAKLVLGVKRVYHALKDDPQVPALVTEYFSQFEDAVVSAALVLGSLGQESQAGRAGFRAHLKEKMSDRAQALPLTLEDSLLGIKALMAAYTVTSKEKKQGGSQLFLLRSKEALLFILNQLWTGTIPRSSEGSAEIASPVLLWKLLTLWDANLSIWMAHPAVFPHHMLANAASKIEDLRTRLETNFNFNLNR